MLEQREISESELGQGAGSGAGSAAGSEVPDGGSRKLVNQVLKAATIESLKLAFQEQMYHRASHPLRCTGLCRLLNTKMPMELAKQSGRWRSDCALRYFQASTELVADYVASIWNSACFVRVRGRGDADVQEH